MNFPSLSVYNATTLLQIQCNCIDITHNCEAKEESSGDERIRKTPSTRTHSANATCPSVLAKSTRRNAASHKCIAICVCTSQSRVPNILARNLQHTFSAARICAETPTRPQKNGERVFVGGWPDAKCPHASCPWQTSRLNECSRHEQISIVRLVAFYRYGSFLYRSFTECLSCLRAPSCIAEGMSTDPYTSPPSSCWRERRERSC